MKKFLKIFSVVFALALILGALVIASSADSSDVKTWYSSDFTELGDGLVVNGAGTATNTDLDSLKATCLKGRFGAVYAKTGTDGNKYIVFEASSPNTSDTYKYGAYMHYNTGAVPAIKSGAFVKGDDFINHKFIVVEADIMSPTGRFATGNLDLQARYIPTGKTAVAFWNTNATSQIFKFASDSNGSYLYSSLSSVAKKYVNPYEFTGIQIIVENNSTVDGSGSVTAYALTTYVYVDGELWFSHAATNVNNDATKYYGGELHAAFTELRINMNYTSSSAEYPHLQTAFDNVAWKTVPADSDTTIADLVDDGSDKPAGVVPAYLNGVEYATPEAAIAAANKGDVVRINADVRYNLTVAKDIYVDVADHTVDLKVGSGYTMRSNGTLNRFFENDSAISIKKYQDYTALVGNTATSGNPSGDNYGWNLKGRYGTVTKGASYDGNANLVFTNADMVSESIPYFGTGYGGAGTTARPKVLEGEGSTVEAPVQGALDAPGSVENYPYLVIDFDVMAPGGAYAKTSIGLQTRFATGASYVYDETNDKYNWTPSLNAENHTNANNSLEFGSDETGSYIKGTGTDPVYLNAEIYNHITIVYHGFIVDDSYATVESFVYVNGELAYSIAASDCSKYASSYYERPHLTWDEVRFQFTDTKFAGADDIAFDNTTTRVISSAYTGNLAAVLEAGTDITAWEDSVYDENLVPVMQPVASLNGRAYDDFAKVFNAAVDGDTVTLLANLEAETVIDKLITVNAGEFTANLVAGEGILLNNTDGVYTATEKTKAVEYVAGGVTKYAYVEDGVSLGTVFAAADADSLVKLLLDYKNSAAVAVTKNITLDMNGKTVDFTLDAKKGSNGFAVSGGVTFTLMSSEIGAKVFGGSANSGGAPAITSGDNNSSIVINGQNESGETTISMYVPTVVQAWQTHCNVTINGGEYYRTRIDNSGFIQLQANFNLDVKDAFIYDFGSGAFHLYGRYADRGSTPSVATIDNCVIISGNVVPYTFADATITFTDCYIDGNINATGVWAGNETHSAQTSGYVTLGEGNYIGGTVSENVVCVDGFALHENESSIEKKAYYNEFTVTDSKVDAKTFEIDEYDVVLEFTHFVGTETLEPVPVIWKDTEGNVIGTTTAIPGTSVSAPFEQFVENGAVLTVVEGWVDGVYDEWNEPLFVPEDATEYVLTAKEGGYIRPYIPKVGFLFNFTTVSHMKVNFYVPAPTSDITVESAYIGDTLRYGIKADGSLQNWSGSSTINGDAYKAMSTWPGVSTSAKSDWDAKITFSCDGYTFTQTVKMNLAKYCNSVLNSTYGEKAKNVVVNMANYVISAHDSIGGSTTSITTELRNIIANNTTRLITPSAGELVVPDLGAIAPYVSKAGVYLNATGPQFEFTLTADGKTKTVSLSTGAANSDYKTKGYIRTANTQISKLRNIKITVTVDSSNSVSATLTLANYAAMLAADGNDAAASVATALYGFATAQYQFENRNK